MKVSVIIPVYNMSKSIAKCVDSILKQTYSDIEVILVDDGSTDDSFSICKLMEEQNGIVKAFHTENRGSGPARNYGMRKATGEYIYFPDADDVLESNAIEILIGTIKQNNCDLVVFGYRCVNTKHKILAEKKYPDICVSGDAVRHEYENYCNMSSQLGIQGAPWNKFFNMKIINTHGIEYPPMKRHQDEVFICRYVAHSEKICFIRNVLYTYNANDLKREWVKYPVNYIDIVEDLRKFKTDIILAWNPENEVIRGSINNEYIFNYIKALELSFSKKFGFSKMQRIDWIRKKVEKLEFVNAVSSIHYLKGYHYQMKVINLIKSRKYISLYILLRTKVIINYRVHWLFQIIRRIQSASKYLINKKTIPLKVGD